MASSTVGDLDDDSNETIIGDDEDTETGNSSTSNLLETYNIGDAGVMPMSTTPFTQKGKIMYKLNGQTGTYGVHVAYKTTKRAEVKYNINGTYQDAAQLAAKLCLGLSIPIGIANQVAGFIVGSIGGFIESFEIDDYYVTCNRTTRHWRLRQMHNISNEYIMKGRRYDVTAKKYTGKKVFYTGEYYRPSEFAAKDPRLAAAIVDHIYAPYSWSVSEWVIY